jgi:hypothetical protein
MVAKEARTSVTKDRNSPEKSLRPKGRTSGRPFLPVISFVPHLRLHLVEFLIQHSRAWR